jgi:hypothetical protein
MARQQPKSFFLYVVDRDKGEFTVEGPMADDTPWTNGVVAAQKPEQPR